MGEEAKNDRQLKPEELSRIGALSDAELKTIDETLLKNTSANWRKVARVVGSAMMELKKVHEGIPDVFFAQRVKLLVGNGLLEAHGNLDRMRYSEVRRQDQNERLS